VLHLDRADTEMAAPVRTEPLDRVVQREELRRHPLFNGELPHTIPRPEHSP
jgi:hypothetical protein